jgi:hypothetical protein
VPRSWCPLSCLSADNAANTTSAAALTAAATTIVACRLVRRRVRRWPEFLAARLRCGRQPKMMVPAASRLERACAACLRQLQRWSLHSSWLLLPLLLLRCSLWSLPIAMDAVRRAYHLRLHTCMHTHTVACVLEPHWSRRSHTRARVHRQFILRECLW